MKNLCSSTLTPGLLTGACLLLAVSLTQAAEYRLIIGDSASCTANGKTGPDCVLPASAVASSTPATSTTATTGSTSSSSGSSGGCVVTSWNNCANSGSSAPASTSQSNVTSPPATTTTTTTTTVAQTSPPPAVSTTAVAGTLDFGSGGLDAGGATNRLEVTGGVTALPFTVIPGRYSGKVSIVPTSTAFPLDGTGVRMWWSRETGGNPLGGSCAANMGSEGAIYWYQENARSYGCAIPSEKTTLYLNVQACISSRQDATCSESGAKPGSTAYVYIRGTKG